MIIIEGMDNTGKTTLAKHLSEMFSLPIVKLVKTTHSDEGVLTIRRSWFPSVSKQALISEVLTSLVIDADVIYDRHFIISEGIYGPALRDKNLLDEGAHGYSMFREKLRSLNPLIIFCRPPEEKILCFNDREQMDGVVVNAHRLIRAYDSGMDVLISLGFTVIKYDFTSLCATVPIEYAVGSYLKIKRGMMK